jgi:hypothetical protein
MQRYALINSQNIVENIVSWDGVSEWTPPENMICLNVENISCDIGSTYNGSIFIKPKPVELEPISQPTKEELIAQINALSAQINALT